MKKHLASSLLVCALCLSTQASSQGIRDATAPTIVPLAIDDFKNRPHKPLGEYKYEVKSVSVLYASDAAGLGLNYASVSGSKNSLVVLYEFSKFDLVDRTPIFYTTWDDKSKQSQVVIPGAPGSQRINGASKIATWPDEEGKPIPESIKNLLASNPEVKWVLDNHLLPRARQRIGVCARMIVVLNGVDASLKVNSIGRLFQGINASHSRISATVLFQVLGVSDEKITKMLPEPKVILDFKKFATKENADGKTQLDEMEERFDGIASLLWGVEKTHPLIIGQESRLVAVPNPNG